VSAKAEAHAPGPPVDRELVEAAGVVGRVFRWALDARGAEKALELLGQTDELLREAIARRRAETTAYELRLVLENRGVEEMADSAAHVMGKALRAVLDHKGPRAARELVAEADRELRAAIAREGGSADGRLH
jgi:ParB-like chromosome segregation protein Spo0J